MGLFKSKTAAELDRIMLRVDMNMSNNYKDAAQLNFKELEDAFLAAKEKGAFKKGEEESYGARIEEYRLKLKGYTHKDQQPYWH